MKTVNRQSYRQYPNKINEITSAYCYQRTILQNVKKIILKYSFRE